MEAPPELTRRAREVADLVALGLTNREIAGRLFLSERTVEWHVEQIFNKLGFSSRSQIAAWVARSQLEAAVLVPRQRGNLPHHFTSFVGRDHELRALRDLLTSNRLTTVIGAGGTGKTRLALRLAEELRPDFQHGVWLCDLAPIVDPSLVDDAIAQALEVKRPGRKRLPAVREHLRDRSVLLVLDNCEHVVTTAAKVAFDLLTTCHGARILATSRKPLGVIGEAIYRLGPLSEPDAMHLFKDRAAAAVPSLGLDGANAPRIAAICRRLDGVPLAIELVVPRLRVQSPDELAAAVLDPAWDVHAEERHSSLRSVAEWSYRLMTAAEQSLFRSLAIFSGWFDAQDAVALFSEPGSMTRFLVASLAEQSMLVQETTPTVRYRLLDTLKAFAVEKLEEAGELEAVRLKHAEYVLGIVELAERMGPPMLAELKLTSIVDDVRAALGILLRTHPQRALWLVAAMMTPWRYDGRYQEALAWNEIVLAANPEPSEQRCRNLFQHALTLADLGRSEEARRCVSEAEAFADGPGNDELRRRTLRVRANYYLLTGDFVSALHLGQQAVDAFGKPGDEDRLAAALNHAALSLLSLGRLHEGKAYAQRALDLQTRITPSRMATLDTLAQAHALLGELRSARQCWLEAAHRGAEIGWKSGIPSCLFGLAFLTGLEGDKERALRLHFAAERLNSALNIHYGDPIARPESELIGRLSSEVEPKVLERVRTWGANLEPGVLSHLLNSSG